MDASLISTGIVALAEVGDKTQIATVALAAQYHDLIANVPAVYLGDRIAHRIPVKPVHAVAAAIFAVLGIATLLGAGAAYGV